MRCMYNFISIMYIYKMNPWLAHLKTFHEAHPELTYKQAMSQAKSTYVKGSVNLPVTGKKKKTKQPLT